MEVDDTQTTLANVFGSVEIRNENDGKEAKEAMIVFDNSIEDSAQL